MQDLILKASGGVSLTASKTNLPLSRTWVPNDRKNARVSIWCTALTHTNGITFKLQQSPDGGATWYDIGTRGQASSAAPISIASATDVTAGTDTLAETSHGKSTGDALIFAAGTAAPGGLTDGTTYFVIKVDANSFKLAATQADAFAGTAVDITSNGTGSQLFQPALYTLRMVSEDSSDYAQLPFCDLLRVVASSGASDTATISNIYVHGE